MNVELTEIEALVIKTYIELAKNKSTNDMAKVGFDKIIQKLERKELK